MALFLFCKNCWIVTLFIIIIFFCFCFHQRQDEFAAIFLINAGANVNAPSAAESPLYLASAGGLRNIVTSLLKKEADPNWQNDKGRTALHVSATAGHVPVVEALLKAKGINSNLLNNQGNSVFRIAFESRNADIAAVLARHANNFSTELDANKCTFLYLAVGKDEGKKEGGDEEGVKFLLGLNVKILTNGQTQEVRAFSFFLYFFCTELNFYQFLFRLPCTWVQG